MGLPGAGVPGPTIWPFRMMSIKSQRARSVSVYSSIVYRVVRCTEKVKGKEG